MMTTEQGAVSRRKLLKIAIGGLLVPLAQAASAGNKSDPGVCQVPDPCDVRVGVRYGPGGNLVGTLTLRPCPLPLGVESHGR